MPGSMDIGTGVEAATCGFPVVGIGHRTPEPTGAIHIMTTTIAAGSCTKATGIMRTTAIIMITSTTIMATTNQQEM